MGAEGLRGSRGAPGPRGDPGEFGPQGIRTNIEIVGDPGDNGLPGILFNSTVLCASLPVFQFVACSVSTSK